MRIFILESVVVWLMILIGRKLVFLHDSYVHALTQVTSNKFTPAYWNLRFVPARGWFIPIVVRVGSG